MELINYKKSYVIYGDDTKKFVNELKNLGGKFCRYLKINNDETIPGWIFSPSKTNRNSLELFLSSHNYEVSISSSNISLNSEIEIDDDMQIITYIIPSPLEKQKCQVQIGNNVYEMIVDKIVNTNPKDLILLKNLDETKDEGLIECYVKCGKWVVEYGHVLNFYN